MRSSSAQIIKTFTQELGQVTTGLWSDHLHAVIKVVVVVHLSQTLPAFGLNPWLRQHASPSKPNNFFYFLYFTIFLFSLP